MHYGVGVFVGHDLPQADVVDRSAERNMNLAVIQRAGPPGTVGRVAELLLGIEHHGDAILRVVRQGKADALAGFIEQAQDTLRVGVTLRPFEQDGEQVDRTTVEVPERAVRGADPFEPRSENLVVRIESDSGVPFPNREIELVLRVVDLAEQAVAARVVRREAQPLGERVHGVLLALKLVPCRGLADQEIALLQVLGQRVVKLGERVLEALFAVSSPSKSRMALGEIFAKDRIVGTQLCRAGERATRGLEISVVEMSQALLIEHGRVGRLLGGVPRAGRQACQPAHADGAHHGQQHEPEQDADAKR
ncbi:MAG: hypothetical protein A2638_01085 [Nitrospirae bacterium RIFCSPHIGHO2_01_FULL_66_17]|nr:MAG: hypothetical protein A2638_01085 [Nitrospirae bacterium RIFCSPHIGHO2_01_FULL_66_17]